MIYRRILGNYLDLYTAQLTWRLSHTGGGPDDSFAALLGTMMTPGRSPMAGYFLPLKVFREKGASETLSENSAKTRQSWNPGDGPKSVPPPVPPSRTGGRDGNAADGII